MGTREGLSEFIELYDTTLRDGAQTRGIQYTVDDKLQIIRMLDDFGIDMIECGWNGSNTTDTDVFRSLSSLSLNKSRLAAFSSSCCVGKRPENDDRFQRSVAVDVPVMTLFSKFWDFQIRHALNTTVEHNLELIHRSVEYCRERFDCVIVDAEHFFDGYKANSQVAESAIREAVLAGADRIVLCDTNGGTLPGEVSRIVERLVSVFPDTHFGVHCHNDTDMAVANSIVAVESGAMHIQGTINGIGERCGNANLCSVIPNLILKYNRPPRHIPRESLSQLKKMANDVARVARWRIPPNQAYVGEDAFTHKAGVHISSVLKYPECYEHVVPESVGNARCLPLSEQSGRAAVKHKVSAMGYTINDAEAEYLLSSIKDQCGAGLLLDEAEASLDLLIHREMNRRDNTQPVVDIIHARVTELPDTHDGIRYATEVAMSIDGRTFFSRAFGQDLYGLAQDNCRKLMEQAGDMPLTVMPACFLHRYDTLGEKGRVLIRIHDAMNGPFICAVGESKTDTLFHSYLMAFMWAMMASCEGRKMDQYAEIA